MPTPQIVRAGLPYIEVRWTAAALTGVFVRFTVYRRIAGQTDADWVRIAIIEDIAGLSYRDYAVASREVYEYIVTQWETIGSDTIEGTAPTPVAQVIVFNYAYLHSVANPAGYFVQIPAFDISEDVVQEITTHVAWGRRQPTAFIGDADYSRLRINGLDDEQRGILWTAVRTIMALQPASAAIFCLRIGISGQRFFVNLEGLSRRGSERMYSPEVTAVETFFEENIPVPSTEDI